MVAMGVVPASTDALTVLSQWRLEPVTVALVLASGSLYVLGIERVRRSGGAWSVGRTAAFMGGLSILVAALISPVDAYADASFTVHMAQHLLLSLLAPPLLALGAPITLGLRAGSPALRRWITGSLRTPVAAALANPVVGWTLFVGIPVLVHASRLFDAALRSTPWHAVEHGLWLGAALIFWWPIVGVDPNPHPVRRPVRMLSLFLAMPAMSFLALGIYSADAPLYATYASAPPPWGEALGDQQAAAVMMWLVGNLALVLAIVLVAAAWKRDEDARQRRLEERQDRADALAGSG
jgi:cytochrome c oxidase assembly factor CtaG